MVIQIKEFAIVFMCKTCKFVIKKPIPCYNNIEVMKAGLKYPDECRCGRHKFHIIEIIGVKAE